MHIFKSSIILFLLLTVISGIFYPLTVSVIAYGFFPYQARGSILKVDGHAVGSILIGQQFKKEQYFWGRPSATGGIPYNGLQSGGANLGPANPELIKILQARISLLMAANPDSEQEIPSELIFSSASGLDPEISLASALYQVPRVAKSRKLSQISLTNIVYKNLQPRTLGFLGVARVNVLNLNLILDKLGDSSANNA